MITLPPWLRLMNAAVLAIDVPALLVETGEASVSVDHARHRYAEEEELPSVRVRFEADEQHPDQGNSQLTQWEELRQLTFSLVADCDLPTEDSGDDPSGLERPARLLAAAKKMLRADGSALEQRVSFIYDGAVVPDEVSTPDRARLVCEIIVVYRVRTDDPNVLLSEGETG